MFRFVAQSESVVPSLGDPDDQITQLLLDSAAAQTACMAVVINNLQRRLSINSRLLREQVQFAKNILTTTHLSSSASATITLTSNFHVKVLNTKYALRRETTDVLSFRFADTPSHDNSSLFDEQHLQALRSAPYLDVSTGELVNPATTENGVIPEIPNHLGDIFLAVPYCQRIARTRSMRTHEYLLLATVHGMAHLMGYVHNSRATRTDMKKAELEVLDAMHDKYNFAQDVETARSLGKPFMPKSYLP